MQIDQLLRRVSWRIRRWIRPSADNDPIVTVEPRPAPAKPETRTAKAIPPRKRRKRRSWLRSAAGFLVTLVVMAAGYGTLVAFNSRVTLDLATAPATGAGESHLVAAAAALLALGADVAQANGNDLLFVPSGRQMRERRLRDGAAQAAARFIMLAAPSRGRPDSALVDARLALGGGAFTEENERIAARDALLRLNARIAQGRASLDTTAPALATLMRTAADACDQEAQALEVLADDPAWIATPASEALMYQARGVAYGWLRLVQAALLDAPELAGATAVEAAIPVEGLERIVDRQPLFLFNGGPSAPWAAPHVADTAADFTRAAIGARALASALEQRAQ